MFPHSEEHLMKPFLDDKFDERFKEPLNQLQWLPWVGRNYLQCPTGRKMLIVGESHYVPANENAEDGYDAKTWTRMFILKEGLKQVPWCCGNKVNPLISNTEKVIIWDDAKATDEFKRKFWSSVAYFNIIQRLLTSRNSRPSYTDWELGWKVFFTVEEILRPDIVLFCGVEASKQISFFEKALHDLNYSHSGIIRHPKVGNTSPRTTIINIENRYSIPVVFIKHPSKCFPVHYWAEFLFSQIPDYLQWICSENKE